MSVHPTLPMSSSTSVKGVFMGHPFRDRVRRIVLILSRANTFEMSGDRTEDKM